MKRFIPLTFLVFSLSIFINGCAQKVSEEEILARFGNQVITKSDLEKGISELSEWKQDRYKDQAGREEYLNQMAEDRMLSLVAAERKLDKDPDIVKQVKEYQDQLMLQELVKQEIDNQIKMTDEDLQKYYADHKADYVETEKVVVTEITFKDEAKAKETLEKIKAGADFTELAKELDAKGESFGPGQGNEGKTRPFTRDSYSSAKEFSETAFNLQPGEMSDIIVQPLGKDIYYMIIRADEHIPSRQQEFSEVKDKVQRIVEKEKKKEKLSQWLEAIKKDKNFKLYLDRMPKEKEEKAEGAGEQKEAESTIKQEEQKSDEGEPGKDTVEEEKPEAQ